eukprot:FR743662.1.p1 GENE.FR743662.1~~FR743662.1.p1  ORF type:complete len:170 (+),score=13.69 FR743662.1:264-773(+)
MAALIAGMKDASVVGEKQALPKPQQAFHLCASAAPSIMLHLITSVGIGQYRAVAVTASIQTMYVPRVGVAMIVMGFEHVDPQLLSLREGVSRAAKHAEFEDQPTLPSMSSVTFEDDVCPVARSVTGDSEGYACPTISSVTYEEEVKVCIVSECRPGPQVQECVPRGVHP